MARHPGHGHVGGDPAPDQLIDLALDAYDPRDRSTAVEAHGKTGGAGVQVLAAEALKQLK